MAPRRVSALPSWLLSQVALEAHRLVTEAGVRRQEFAVLAGLAEGGPASQAELGRRVLMDRSDLHGVLNHLQRAGLVARVRDKQDRRRNVVRLSPAGAQRLRELEARAAAAQDELLAPLSEDEQRELRRLLIRLVEAHRGGG
jgi:DNA-binding MarR family transcriptional regulator